MNQLPSVGRIVHFYKKNLAPLAAIITKVISNDVVHLVIFETNDPKGFERMVDIEAIYNCKLSDKPRYHHWGWPARH